MAVARADANPVERHRVVAGLQCRLSFRADLPAGLRVGLLARCYRAWGPRLFGAAFTPAPALAAMRGWRDRGLRRAGSVSMVTVGPWPVPRMRRPWRSGGGLPLRRKTFAGQSRRGRRFASATF
ncbi:MAG: hypothetical protein AUI16_01670 [Alphaproteobacteria bacterium 13_2_20CM_2_64_7]|nr:MAG: hypothetical protein AUI16_01670 [Alphaproteobacteria bacterium 13_2_20CM_2_64_7]